ncbi:DinB family protein [Kineococcus indalonis]|uniref:DinB family protein n=1 Tax=Kineococcus indalonis TaxID=2696566 RepID=UPI0014126E79|nr:DinB family protein [Kineococcus indalonis]NAZ86781.1 hypothetical protein [Kineococcus indalonis]
MTTTGTPTAADLRVAVDALQSARRSTLALTDFDDAELTAQHSPLMSPLVWDLAHVGQQEEHWLLQVADPGRDPVFHPAVARLYDAFEHPRATRTRLPLLDARASRRALADVRARVLDALPGAHGLCVDTSAPALRRAARAHPRAAALGADAWRALPLADGCADLVTTVFAPRGEAEVARVLRPGGAWVVLTPLPAHLEQVRGALGMVAVEERKQERLAADLAGFAPAAQRELSLQRPLDRDALRDLVLMGPSAHHVDAAGLEERLAGLPPVVDVTVAVRLTAVTRPG